MPAAFSQIAERRAAGHTDQRQPPFRDFDPLNQDTGQLLYAYLSSTGDRTSDLQNAVTGGADPTETLCDNVEFPGFGLFGVNIATTNSGTERSLVFGCAQSGAFALKTDPGNSFYNGEPLEGIGVQKYWTIEASSGAGDKGSIMDVKAFDEQWDFEEATPDWSLDFEMSYVGDIRGTGDDVIRIIDRNVHADPDRVLRRARHYDVRTGALIGTVVFNAPFD